MAKKTAKKATAKKVKGELVNDIVFIMDASGSMSGLEDSVIKLLNDQLAHLKTEFYRGGQKSRVSVITFDYAYNINYVYKNVDIETARKVTRADYKPYGSTALFDAVGKGINDFLGGASFNEPETSFVVIAYTDGHENASQVYRSGHQLATLIHQAQNTRRFTVTFQVPRGHKHSIISLGVPDDNVREFEATERGVYEASQNTSAGLTRHFSNRALGLTETRNFYVETDLSKLKTSDLKRNLDDISSEYGIFVADWEGQIRDFVEDKTQKPYQKGGAYYQLIKKETVQGDKDILIYDKLKMALYGGDDARGLVGLPVGADAKVTPGDHANYEIFVQSTSVNRKLMVGQKVAVKVT